MKKTLIVSLIMALPSVYIQAQGTTKVSTLNDVNKTKSFLMVKNKFENLKPGQSTQIIKNVNNFKGISTVARGSEGVGGGDEVGLEFHKAFSVALKNLMTDKPEVFHKISAEKLSEKAAMAKIIVVDGALDVAVKEIIQSSVATNNRSTNTILINRSRWVALNDNWLKEGIALHEIASLAGLEQTGFYPISSLYVSMMGGGTTSLIEHLSVNVMKQVAAQTPQASPKEILQKLFDESSVPASLNDFDLNSDKTSNQQCQGIGFQISDDIDTVLIRRANVTIENAAPDRGPLFPAHPAIQEERLVFAIMPEQFEKLVNDPKYLEAWSHGASSMSTTENELLVKTRYTAQGRVNALENRLLARRNGDLLVLKMSTVSLRPAEVGVDSTPKYIYCYRR